ncbi:MAG: glucose-1-phosphate cytidylyltransferase [Eubacteriales bacterium]|nr:glucose-1-phosphate cytidylyltransferase [Eubacteriales bacterium]
MKVVILAGGLGTRISEESHLKPKPMIEIGTKPILWHIMKYYSEYGFNEFVICLGYKQYLIKEFFADYLLHTSDITIDTKTGELITHHQNGEDWKVTLVDTGLNTLTGGRIKRIREYINDETFMLTYGDGLSNVNINKLINFHKKNGKLLTLTTVNIANQKGILDITKDGEIKSFREKDNKDHTIINGGFMVCEPKIIDYICDDNSAFEQEPMKKLVEDNQVMGYFHDGFWQCMDTQREMKYLNELWEKDKAPWKIWK